MTDITLPPSLQRARARSRRRAPPPRFGPEESPALRAARNSRTSTSLDNTSPSAAEGAQAQRRARLGEALGRRTTALEARAPSPAQAFANAIITHPEELTGFPSAYRLGGDVVQIGRAAGNRNSEGVLQGLGSAGLNALGAAVPGGVFDDLVRVGGRAAPPRLAPEAPMPRPGAPAREWARAGDGSVMPVAQPQPLRAADRGGSADLMGATRLGNPPPRVPLPMDEASRMARAREMGFTTPAYRGLSQEPRDVASRTQWFSESPDVASTYARNGAANVMPAQLRVGRQAVVSAPGAVFRAIPVDSLPRDLRRDIPRATAHVSTDEVASAALSRGYDSVRFQGIRDSLSGESGFGVGDVGDVIAIFSPANIRSRFAAFDPARSGESDLLAGVSPFAALAVQDQQNRNRRRRLPSHASADR